MNQVLLAAGGAVVGAAGGWLVRWGSVKLAVMEELEPGHKPWQVYGPPAVTAVLFAAFAFTERSIPLLVLDCVCVLILVQVIFFDLEHRLILDRVMFPSMLAALVVSVIWRPVGEWGSTDTHRWDGIATGIAAALLFLLLGLVGQAIFKAEAMGFGDVKFALFMGLVLGPLATVQALFYGVLLAGVVSIGVIVWTRSMRGTIAYGPYLAAGTLIMLFRPG
ncbi:MAG TPA: A24 family peptidase [Patescibacteria group bacterium]|nr:A24 family peptidase [Patescibacteria group bacterium]